MGSNQILVVDDEIGIRELLSEILKDEGFTVRAAENAASARAIRKEIRPDLVLLDIWMPDTDGISLLKEWAVSGQLTMPVVMMSGHGTIESAMEATRIGAVDFLEKPISMPKLLATVGKALSGGSVLPRPGLSFSHLGRARVMVELQQRLEQAARLKTPVLLTGEPGCGFELCARQLHQRNAPWLAPSDLSWLATNPFEPLNEVKDGVLYLSEIHTLQRPEQKGLLQLTAKLEKFNVRLVCSASQPLVPLVDQDRFDAQLFSQISALTLRVPSLKEHAEDIPELASTVLSQMVDAGEVPLRNLNIAALNVLRNLSWPGNLPVLRNVIKTLALTATQPDIGTEEVHRVVRDFGLDTQEAQPAFAGVPLDMPLREARERFEYQYFLHHIRREDSNMSRVADRVGLERTHLYRKLKQLGIKPSGKTEDPAQ